MICVILIFAGLIVGFPLSAWRAQRRLIREVEANLPLWSLATGSVKRRRLSATTPPLALLNPRIVSLA